jgi:hypothetical protein
LEDKEVFLARLEEKEATREDKLADKEASLARLEDRGDTREDKLADKVSLTVATEALEDYLTVTGFELFGTRIIFFSNC